MTMPTTPEEWKARNKQVIEHVRANSGVSPSGSKPVLLTTVGAKTGRQHTVPLACMPEGDQLIVFGSNMGGPRQPDWYYNILKDPHVTVEYLGQQFETTARIAEGDERSQLWAIAAERSPIAAQHQAKTTRQFPIVILTPPST